MGLPNVMNTGRTGMMASKAAIATTGHNISNANTEGYSRQKVETTASIARPHGNSWIGTGTTVKRVERVNDEYLEKNLRNATRDFAGGEERDLSLRQVEDIFNEMNGEGLNRIMARFFNEFRKLANDPDSDAVRQSVREASQAMINDFKRLRTEVEEVRRHIDSRLEGYVREVNELAGEMKDLNIRIANMEIGGGDANDLRDRRDEVLKKLGTYMDLSMHKDNLGSYIVDVRGIGPLVAGPNAERFSVDRTPGDGEGKADGSLSLRTTASASPEVTHQIKGGKFGALVETRDQVLSTILNKLDDLAYSVSTAVNELHQQGITRDGLKGVNFFNPLESRERAAEYLRLSDEVESSINNIASGAVPDAPGDNRIAIAIAGVQHLRTMNEGRATMDDYYNSIVSDVGVVSQRNRSAMNQQKDIVHQLSKIRDQISGVSIDEETANLMQFQHTFDASAKVIQVADEMLKTVLDIKR